jgi:2-isopropylmalate synthase
MSQQIEVGPMSGKSNVIYWLESRGLEATDERVQRIYDRAKSARGVLSEEEVRQLV